MIFFCSLFCYNHFQNPSASEASRKKLEASATSVSILASNSNVTTTLPSNVAPPSAAASAVNTLPTSMSTSANSRTGTIGNKIVVNKASGQSVSQTTQVTTVRGPTTLTSTIPIEINHKIIFVPPKPKEMKNKSVMCRLAEVDRVEEKSQTSPEKLPDIQEINTGEE